MKILNTKENLFQRKFAIWMISTGFSGMISLIFLIFIDFKRINFLVAIMIPFKVFFCFMSACIFLAGIVLFCSARKKKPSSDGNYRYFTREPYSR